MGAAPRSQPWTFADLTHALSTALFRVSDISDPNSWGPGVPGPILCVLQGILSQACFDLADELSLTAPVGPPRSKQDRGLTAGLCWNQLGASVSPTRGCPKPSPVLRLLGEAGSQLWGQATLPGPPFLPHPGMQTGPFLPLIPLQGWGFPENMGLGLLSSLTSQDSVLGQKMGWGKGDWGSFSVQLAVSLLGEFLPEAGQEAWCFLGLAQQAQPVPSRMLAPCLHSVHCPLLTECPRWPVGTRV